MVALQVVPDQQEPERGQPLRPPRGRLGRQPVLPTAARTRLVRSRRGGRENRRQLLLQPGQQYGIGRPLDGLRADFPRRRAEQGEQLGRPAAQILVRVVRRVAGRLPGRPGLRDRLIGADLILTPQPKAQPFGRTVSTLNHVFLGVASGSMTVVTVPSFRLRWAVPVWHQVRVICQVYPASQSVIRIVQVLTVGSPSDAVRKARCKVVNDQVAVPSCSRSGGRWNSWRMRSCSITPYRRTGPPRCRGSTAASPSRLKRATSWATATRERRPAARAAAVKGAPSATASRAFARATRAAASLPARAIRASSLRSSSFKGRNGSCCRPAIRHIPLRPAHRRGGWSLQRPTPHCPCTCQVTHYV